MSRTVGGGRIGGLPGFPPGQSYSLSAEQIVDNPVPRRGFGGGLHGLHPGQSSSAFYRTDQRFPEATAEQNVDIPVPCGAPHDFHKNPLPAAGSSDLLETANQGFFSTFHRGTGRGLQLMAYVSLAGACPFDSGTAGSTGSLGYNMGCGCFFMVPVADVVLASAVSLWSTLFQLIMAASVRLGRGPRHASTYDYFWKNFFVFSSPLCSRSSHLEIGTLFP